MTSQNAAVKVLFTHARSWACTAVLETLMVCNNRKQETMNFKIEIRAIFKLLTNRWIPN